MSYSPLSKTGLNPTIVTEHDLVEKQSPTSHVDTVTFILRDEGDMEWLPELLYVFSDVGDLLFKEKKSGKNHYKHGGILQIDKATFAELNWGGLHQNSTLQLMLKGLGCSLIKNWQPVVQRLTELHSCKISRIDIAIDVFDGSITLEDVWALRKDRSSWIGKKGGRLPKFLPVGDMTERGSEGRTIYIGTRDSDLYTRVYEKGMQLFSRMQKTENHLNPRSAMVALEPGGKPFACGDYVRFESEFKAKTSILPLQVLLDPDSLMAGAYPICQKLLNHKSPYVRLRQEHVAMTNLEKILRQVRKQYGASLHSAVNKLGEDRVLDLIIASYPNKRLSEIGLNLADRKNTPSVVDERGEGKINDDLIAKKDFHK